MMESAMTAILRDASGKMHHGILFARRLVMIGRRKPAYDSIDKVMRRLDRIMKVLEAMRHIVVNVH